jgi:hypothetical protein
MRGSNVIRKPRIIALIGLEPEPRQLRFNQRDSRQKFLRRVSDGLIQPSLTRPQGLSSHNVGNYFTLRKEKSPNRLDYYRRGDFFLAF